MKHELQIGTKRLVLQNRTGKILKQGVPQALMSENSVCTLEDVFYSLCYKDEAHGYQNASSIPLDQDGLMEVPLKDEYPDANGIKVMSGNMPSKGSTQFVVKALLYKNMIGLSRHKIFMTFFVCMPLVSLLLFIACIGKMPQGLTISVVSNSNCTLHQDFSFANKTCLDILDTGM